MKNNYLLPLIAVLSSSCATMSDSLQLGGGMGALTGATASFVAHKSVSGQSPAFENVALGAGIGLATGLITSYFVHKSVDEKRASIQGERMEMHFGDLPPSPFLVPTIPYRKGGR